MKPDQRPVDVTFVPEATFDDMLEMGIGSLATRDATVIERVTEPGHKEFVEEVTDAITSGVIKSPPEVAKFVKMHPQHTRITALHGALILQQREGGAGHISTTAVTSLVGIPPTKRGSNFQAPHVDENESHELRVTMSYMLYQASKLPWTWRITPNAFIHDTARRDAQPFVDVPLVPLGCVILGENSRRSDDNNRPRSAGHQVRSPRSAWKGTNVKRARLLVYN